jgi:pSer/pThr/pTyr-binding forkhead associated (FHA) protein
MGLVLLSFYRAELAKEKRESFLGNHPGPFFVVEPFARAADPESQTVSTSKGVGTDVTVARASPRKGVPAPMLTIGRATNNDVVILAPNVSKLHCYLMRTPEGATLSDAGSHNGTTVRGQKLRASVDRALLASGETFSLGDLAVTYFTAEGFWEFATVGR